MPETSPEIRGLIGDAERMIAHVAGPDLRGRPCYILPASSVRGWDDAVCDAMIGPAFDLLYRGAIGDRWRGRGPCAVIYDGDECAADLVAGLALHEVAHALAEGWQYPDRPIPLPPVTVASQDFVSAVAAGAFDATYFPIESNIASHGIPFMRTMCHLITRATDAGFKFPAGPAFCPGFRLSPWRWYLAAVEAEARERRHWAFARINKTPAPPALAQLWTDDVAAFRELVRESAQQSPTESHQ